MSYDNDKSIQQKHTSNGFIHIYFLLQPNIKKKVSCKLKCVLKENCIKRMLILYFTKIDKNTSYYHIVELVCKQ